MVLVVWKLLMSIMYSVQEGIDSIFIVLGLCRLERKTGTAANAGGEGAKDRAELGVWPGRLHFLLPSGVLILRLRIFELISFLPSSPD